jgi:hypothetical protein
MSRGFEGIVFEYKASNTKNFANVIQPVAGDGNAAGAANAFTIAAC